MAESNKTEKATPERRRKAREQGQVARSREFGGALALVGALLVVNSTAESMAGSWRSLYVALLREATTADFHADGAAMFWVATATMRWVAFPLIAAMCLSVAVTLAQGGLNFAPAALAPKPERLSPASRMGQVFSMQAVVGMMKSLVPFAIIALLGASGVRSHWAEMARASQLDARQTTGVVAQVLHEVAWKSVLVLLVWGGVDYLMTWRQSESKMRMSHDEIKREHKESDGNPFTKAQIRKRQRAMRGRKPLEAAATATMVITNPTHFAVALRYEPGMAAPEVVAKGTDLLAQKIKAIATENGVPLIENKPLARALHKNVEVGHTIPADMYQAVAEILVAVFRAQSEVREQEARRRGMSANGGAKGTI